MRGGGGESGEEVAAAEAGIAAVAEVDPAGEVGLGEVERELGGAGPDRVSAQLIVPGAAERLGEVEEAAEEVDPVAQPLDPGALLARQVEHGQRDPFRPS